MSYQFKYYFIQDWCVRKFILADITNSCSGFTDDRENKLHENFDFLNWETNPQSATTISLIMHERNHILNQSIVLLGLFGLFF